jgi:hypothetical protein
VTGGGERGPELPEDDERAPLAVGIAIWVVLLVLSLVFRSSLSDHGRGWWFGVTLAGVLQGLFALWFVSRRRARLAALAVAAKPSD